MIRPPEALRINLVDVFGPGRTRREPSAVRNHLQAADRCTIAWRMSEDALDWLAGEVCGPDLLRREPLQHFLLPRSGLGLDAIVKRFAELDLELAIDFPGVAAHSRHDLRREQCRHDAVFVRCPDAAVDAHERRARALLSSKAERTVEQASHEPFEADRCLVELPSKLGRHAIDHPAAYHCLTYCC